MSRKIKNHMELKPRLGTAAVYVNRVSSPSPKAVLGPPFFFFNCFSLYEGDPTLIPVLLIS